MSFTPRPQTGDDLGDETVDGATEMVGAATVMLDAPTEDHIAELVGATTNGASVLVTELGGVTPTEKKVIATMARPATSRPVARASTSAPGAAKPTVAPRRRDAIVNPATADGGATETVRLRETNDPHEMPTHLGPSERVTSRAKTRTPAKPGAVVDSDTFVKVVASDRTARGDDTTPNAQFDDTNPRTRAVRADETRSRSDDTKPRAAVELPSAKKTLGGYRVTNVLASGQMGVVYRGEHPTQRRTAVAIKSVQSELSSNPAVVARFFAESIVLARIDHPNVVRFHDFGYDAQGSAYLVMELLEGETLTKRLAREKRLDISAATDIALQMTQGLAAAHKQGVIHRDIKPDNVFLCNDGTVKLLDFGVAKLEGQGPTHTLQGDLLGTAAYMAPEQGRSASESDVRSDLYSVGCVLFEMVCGVVPYPGSLVETLLAHQTAERPPARALNPDVSSELDAIIDKLLQRDPAQRPQTASEVIKTLGALEATSERPVRGAARRRRGVIVDPTDVNTLVGRPRWVTARAKLDVVIQRFVDEPIALGLLLVVVVLLLVLIVRH